MNHDTDGCHNCAHRAGVLCAADPPRDKWRDFNGRYPATGATCPEHKLEARYVPRYPTEVIQAAFGRVTGSWPEALRSLGMRRVAAGNEAHAGEDVTALDVAGEALEEALDVGGYAGLARLTGRWSWRWALAVVLAGWIARLMQAERGRVE